MDKIITAKDYAKRAGFKTVTEYIQNLCLKKGRLIDTPMEGEPTGEVVAEINWGRWIAKCPDCNGAEDVDPDEPIFYCFSCGNYKNRGKPRKVKFPSKKVREEIEAELLKRPVEIKSGANEIDRLVNAQPKIKDKDGVLSRCWTPGETVGDLKKQNKAINGKN